MLGLIEFTHLTYSYEKLIDFLIQHGVLTSTIKCIRCNSDINMNRETLMYCCRKRYFTKNAHKKRISKQCNFTRSVRTGTCFNRSHIDIATICKVIACFLMLKHPRKNETKDEVGISSVTIAEWFNFCREVCVFWAKTRSQKLGGPGCTVELDVAQIEIVEKKYNSHQLIGEWVFGGYERDTKKIFIVSVEDRTKKTLLACVKEWVLPGTTIVLDRWQSYNCLDDEDFQSLAIKYSYNFVKPEKGLHTWTKKRVWGEVRGNISSNGAKHPQIHVLKYFCEYLFKRAYRRLERIEMFFDVIAESNSLLSENQTPDQIPSTTIT